MEVYISPRVEGAAGRLSRERVLGALTQAGLKVTRVEERAAGSDRVAWWELWFDEAALSLRFQETSESLVFATLEQSVFDASPLPDLVCGILERLGWEVDQENVG